MFRKTVVFCVFLSLAAIVQSCLYPSGRSSQIERIGFLNIPSPDSTLTVEHAADWYESRYRGYDAVYLERRLTHEQVGGYTRWKHYEVSKQRHIVLNPEAEWATTFRVSVEDTDQTLDSVYLTVTTPGGKTSHFGKDDLLIEQTGGGVTVYRFVYPDVHKGSMIEEGYIIRTKSGKRPLISEHFFAFQTRVPAEKVVYKYIRPHWTVRFKRIGKDVPVPYDAEVDDETGARILEVQENDVAALAEEAWSPHHLENGSYLKFSMVERKKGRYIVTMPLDWSVLFNGMRIDQNAYKDMRLNEIMSEIARTATMDATSDIDTISAINKWVQTNIELGKCENCEWDEVLRQKRGDIMSILEITMGLLDYVDVQSNVVMIHPANHGYFDKWYLSYSELLPPGVAAYTGRDTLVLYPFIEDLPAGLLPPAWQERPAMYIDVEDSTTIGVSPRGAVDENTEEEEYDLTIDEDGLISVREKKFFRGISAYLMRSALREAKESEMEDFMSELLTYEEGNVELGEYTIENLDDYRQPLEITLNYTIDNLVTVTPEEVIFQTGGLFSPSSERKIKIETDERVNPIRIYADEEVIKRITINHPPEWKLETKLKPVEFNNQFGELNATYTSESGRFTAEQRRLLKKSSEPKEQIDDLMLITSRRSQLSIPTLIFAVKEM